MERKSEKDAVGNTDRSLFARIAEAAVVFAICGFLVRQAVESILAVKVPLIVITAIVGLVFISWRAYRWRKKHDDY